MHFYFILYIIVTPSGQIFVHFVTEFTVNIDTKNLYSKVQKVEGRKMTWAPRFLYNVFFNGWLCIVNWRHCQCCRSRYGRFLEMFAFGIRYFPISNVHLNFHFEFFKQNQSWHESCVDTSLGLLYIILLITSTNSSVLP